jgi:xanthine dehydrogenase small subunit
MRDHLRLFINGQRLRVAGGEAFMTLAEFLRRRRQLTGTKIVCAEGDCGACAVLVGRACPEANVIQYASVNACIQLMFQLDATHVVTVEGLKTGENLSPIQESMVKCQGTQCGFCTPGFVVSLHDLMEHNRQPTAHDVRRALVGNLCRCTGYDSIVRAALESDRSELKSIDALYPPDDILAALAHAAGEEVQIESDGARFFKPVSVEAAARFRQQNPSCLIVSGATDLGVQRNKGTRQISIVMTTAGLRDLQTIAVTPDGLCIGAGATLTELERVTATHLPELSEFLAFFGSPLIKNAATLAGNLVNASPIGDTIPALFVLAGQVELTGPDSARWVEIEKFYTGYRKTVLKTDEILTRVRLPLPRDGEIFKLYKVSKRKDLDISSFGAAIWMRRSGPVVQEIRIAYGGVGPTVVRLPRTEAFLAGKPASRHVFQQAGDLAGTEISPISDVRGSEDYRKILGRNILVKFWHDMDQMSRGPEQNISPTPAGVQSS